jgi:hypothetical protein
VLEEERLEPRLEKIQESSSGATTLEPRFMDLAWWEEERRVSSTELTTLEPDPMDLVLEEERRESSPKSPATVQQYQHMICAGRIIC